MQTKCQLHRVRVLSTVKQLADCLGPNERLRTDIRHHVPFEVVHLLFSPQLDHLAWVLLPKSIFEAVVILDVAVSVLELIESCLEDFDGTLWGDGLALQAVCM